MKTLHKIILATAVVFGSAASVAAQDFDIRYGPLRVGTLMVQAITSEGTYRSRLTIRTTGLAGAARPVRFVGTSTGQTAPWPQPERYREEVDTGRRVSSAQLVWQGPTPEVVHYTAEPAETAPPADSAARKAALDPASAVFAALTTAPFCGLSFTVFDGQRLNSISFDAGRQTETGLTCAGHLTRLAGYSAKDLEERPGLDLSLVYQQDGAALRLVEAEVQTLYGKLRLKRR